MNWSGELSSFSCHKWQYTLIKPNTMTPNTNTLLHTRKYKYRYQEITTESWWAQAVSSPGCVRHAGQGNTDPSKESELQYQGKAVRPAGRIFSLVSSTSGFYNTSVHDIRHWHFFIVLSFVILLSYFTFCYVLVHDISAFYASYA